MRESLMINGHHIYTIEELFPFLYRFRIGVGRWRYAFNGVWVKELCNDVEDRVVAVVRY